jgi:outer membrane protein assembly factor BamB
VLALACASALTCLAAESEKPSPAGQPAEWPTFRGNAAQTGVAACPLPDRLQLLWTYEAGAPVLSTAAIMDGVAYLGTMKGDLLAIDLATGRLKWRYKTEGAIEAAPGIQDGKLFVGTNLGVFNAVSAATGKKLWSFEAASQIISSANFTGAPSTTAQGRPEDARTGGNVLFGSYDHFLYCLSEETGEVVWKFQTDAELHASPCIAAGAAVIGGCDARLRVIDAAHGTQRGVLALSFNVASSPAFDGGRIYVSTYDNHMYCVALPSASASGEALSKVWDVQVAEEMHFRASPAVLRDRVIFAGQDGVVRCLAAADGHELWKFRARDEINSSPVIAGDRVFFGSNDGTLYALKIADGASVWSFAAGAEIEASPAVGEERLVIGARDGAVYCFGAAGGAR